MMRARRMSLWPAGLAVVAVLLARTASVWAIGDESTSRGEDLVVTVNSKWCGNASGGYYPIRLRIANRGRSRTLTARYRTTYDQQLTVDKTVTVPQNAAGRLTLSIPCVGPMSYGELQVLDQGRPIRALTQSIALPDLNNSGPARTALLVISPHSVNCDPFEEAVNIMTSAAAAGSYWYGSAAAADHEVVPLNLLPTSWIDYSGVDLVAVSLPNLQRLPVDERTALLHWMHAGGNLIIYDLGGPPPDSSELDGLLNLADHAGAAGWVTAETALRRWAPPFVEADPYGGGPEEMEVAPPEQGAAEFQWPAEAFFYRDVMLGRVYAFESNPFPGSRHDWNWLLATLAPFRATWPQRMGISARMPSKDFLNFLVPSVRGVHVFAFLILITLFTIAIGPVNYLWLWKKGKLHLLLLTIPLIAAVTSITLFAYSAFAHGFATRSRTRSFTFIDQGADAAVTVSRLSLYAGLAPSGGLKFSPSTAVFPIWPPGGRFDAGSVDWTETQQWGSGWLRSRTRTQFLTVSHRDERGRLDVSPDQDSVRIANGLEWNLQTLVVADERGRLFFGSDVKAGDAMTLEKLNGDHRVQISELVKQFPLEPPKNSGDRIGWTSYPIYMNGYEGTGAHVQFESSLMERAIASFTGGPTAPLQLPSRAYVAIVDGNPGVELGVEQTAPEADLHVLVGHY